MEDIRELIIKEDFVVGGVNAISLVYDPAMEEDFMLFNKAEDFYTFARVDEEKRIVTGPAMIPNKNIVRYDRDTNEKYYIYFSKKTIEQVAEGYLKNHRQENTTLQHEVAVNGTYVVESWIVTNPENDKAKELGYNVNEGTWMVSMKINNDELWNDYIKAGKAKGFSIEGQFTEKFSKQEEPLTENETLLQKVHDLILEEFAPSRVKVVNIGKHRSKFIGKQKYRWTLGSGGVSEKNCPSCKERAGLVKTFNTWRTAATPRYCENHCTCTLVRV